MSQLDVIGWREWIHLPHFSDTPALKTKIDTGARSSTLDATRIELIESGSQLSVKFRLQLSRHRNGNYRDCEMPLVRTKKVRSSSGEEQQRPFIQIPIQVGTHSWTIEASLTDRGRMVHRMLIGRLALENRFVVDSARKFVFGKPAKK